MSAFGELIIDVVYFILGLLCLVFLVLTITSRKSIKPWTLIVGILFGFFISNHAKTTIIESTSLVLSGVII